MSLVFVQFAVLVFHLALLLEGDDDETDEDVHHEEGDDDDEGNVEQRHGRTRHVLRPVVIIPTVDRPENGDLG